MNSKKDIKQANWLENSMCFILTSVTSVEFSIDSTAHFGICSSKTIQINEHTPKIGTELHFDMAMEFEKK